MALLYLTASPDVIIILLRTVSSGYDAMLAPLVIIHPSPKLAKKLSCSLPRLAVHVEEPIELPLASALAGLVVVGEAGARVVEGVDEELRRGAGGAAGGDVPGEPAPVAVAVAAEGEEGLEVVLEGEVEGLGWEVADDVGVVAAPEGEEAFVADGAAEAVGDPGVGLGEASGPEELVLVLE
nr:unnamed protein product [Digitaria exilis]